MSSPTKSQILKLFGPPFLRAIREQLSEEGADPDAILAWLDEKRTEFESCKTEIERRGPSAWDRFLGADAAARATAHALRQVPAEQITEYFRCAARKLSPLSLPPASRTPSGHEGRWEFQALYPGFPSSLPTSKHEAACRALIDAHAASASDPGAHASLLPLDLALYFFGRERQPEEDANGYERRRCRALWALGYDPASKQGHRTRFTVELLTGGSGELYAHPEHLLAVTDASFTEALRVARDWALGEAGAPDPNADFRYFEEGDLAISSADGPSIGPGAALAIKHLLTGEMLDPDCAVPGRLTPQGEVLPVPHVKDKVLACLRKQESTVIYLSAVCEEVKGLYLDNLSEAQDAKSRWNGPDKIIIQSIRSMDDIRPSTAGHARLHYLTDQVSRSNEWRQVFVPPGSETQEARPEVRRSRSGRAHLIPDSQLVEPAAGPQGGPVTRPLPDLTVAVEDRRYTSLALVGAPGIGKTTSLKWLALLYAWRSLFGRLPDGLPETVARSITPLLPLSVSLADYEKARKVIPFLKDNFESDADPRILEEFRRSLEQELDRGHCLVFFDALNEMPRGGDYAKRLKRLRKFATKYARKGNRIVFTCRERDYGTELGQRIDILPFDEDRIGRLVLKLAEDMDFQGPGLLCRIWGTETARAFCARQERPVPYPARLPDEAGSDTLRDLAVIPLTLTLLCEVYAAEGQLPASAGDLFRRFQDLLLKRASESPGAGQPWLEDEEDDVTREATAFLLERLGFLLNEEALEARARGQENHTASWARIRPRLAGPVPVSPTAPLDVRENDLEHFLAFVAGTPLVENRRRQDALRFRHHQFREFAAGMALLRLWEQKTISIDQLKAYAVKKREPDGPFLWLERDMPTRDESLGNWDPLPGPPQTGWEEALVLAAGGAEPQRATELIEALSQVNPVLAGRCLHEGRVTASTALEKSVQDALIRILEDEAIALRVRIAAGDVLGHLGDPRIGILHPSVHQPSTINHPSDDASFILPDFACFPACRFRPGVDDDEIQKYKGQIEGQLREKTYGFGGEKRPEKAFDLNPFGLAKYPVTYAEYELFMEHAADRPETPLSWDNPRFHRPNYPVVGVSWHDAVAYCQWLTEQIRGTEHEEKLLQQIAPHHSPLTTHSIEIRLAAEAEWERAARGIRGQRPARLWPWESDGFEPGDFWSRLNASPWGEGRNPNAVNSTTPVGVYPGGKTPEGVHDLSGNVWEWCNDLWTEEYHGASEPAEPSRVLRGGAWDDFPYFARPSFRLGDLPDYRDFDAGFRLLFFCSFRR